MWVNIAQFHLQEHVKKNSIAIIRILHSFYTHDCASQRIFIPASKTSKTRLTDLDIYISPKRKGFTCKNIMEKTSIAIIRIFHSCSLDSSLDIYLQSAKILHSFSLEKKTRKRRLTDLDIYLHSAKVSLFYRVEQYEKTRLTNIDIYLHIVQEWVT